MSEHIKDVESNQSDVKTAASAKLFEECYNGECKTSNTTQPEVTKGSLDLPELALNQVVSTEANEVKDQPVKEKDLPPLVEADYTMLAYGIHNGNDLGYRLRDDLAKGFTDSRIDLKRLNEHLAHYGLKVDLNPLESGLQLNLSRNGTLIDSEVSKTPESRTKGKLMSWEERWKDQLKDVNVKDFLARYEHAVKNQEVSEEFLQALRTIGNKASKDLDLAKLIRERGEMDGVNISFDQDSASIWRRWRVGESYNHASRSVSVKTSFDGSETSYETNMGGPFTIGQNNRGKISAAEAGKMLFGSERPGSLLYDDGPIRKIREHQKD